MKVQRSIIGLLCSILTVASAVSTPITGPVVPAKAAESFSAGYLVSDTVFTARDAMGVAEIQSFLESKGSVLASLSPDYLGENANGRSAAQIIWDASRANMYDYGGAGGRPSNPFQVSINPQVILATLQKETSLITGSYTPGSATLNNMLRIAMGMGCPDSGGCDPYYAGFANQVLYGTAQLWLGYWRAQNSIGSYLPGQAVTTSSNQIYQPYCSSASMSFTVANAATSSLYRYTPHTCNGNANFWYFLNNWFRETVNTFSPNARLLQGSAPAVFAYWPSVNKKWPIYSLEAAKAWAIYAPVQQVSDEYLNSIPTGSGGISRLQKGAGDPIYYVEGGTRYHLRTDKIFDLYGVSWNELRSIDESAIAQLHVGPPQGMLARSAIRPEVYLITANRKYYVPDEFTLRNWGFVWSDLSYISQWQIDVSNNGDPLSWLVKTEVSDSVYLVSDSQRMYVPSQAMLDHWRLDFSMLRLIGREMVPLLPEGKQLTQVARGMTPEVYLVRDGVKRYVPNEAALRQAGFSMNDVVRVSSELLNRLPTGPQL